MILGWLTEEKAAAHERLLKTLPSRTYGNPLTPAWVLRRAAKLQRPVIIYGKRYESLKHAAEALDVTRATIGYYIKTRRKGCRYA